MWKATQKSNLRNVSTVTNEDKTSMENHNATRGLYTYEKVEKVKPIETLATKEKAEKPKKE